MNNTERKSMIALAINRMAGFRLEGSSDGDNRSVFSLIETLIRSAGGDALEECKKPLAVIYSIRTTDHRARFQGCKLTLLQQTIEAMFADRKAFFPDKEFSNWERSKLLEYLEICRRIFVSGYAMTMPKKTEAKTETAFERAERLAREKKNKR